jgi:hypothetical protein
VAASTALAAAAEVAAGLWLQVPVVHLHVHDPHELDLRRQFLDLLLKTAVDFCFSMYNCIYLDFN